MAWADGLKQVELFGTIVWQTPRAYLFQCEDEGEPVWLAKSLASWDGVTMTMPRWLAKKNNWVSELPPDDHHAWWIILKATKPVFHAKSILVVKQGDKP